MPRMRLQRPRPLRVRLHRTRLRIHRDSPRLMVLHALLNHLAANPQKQRGHVGLLVLDAGR